MARKPKVTPHKKSVSCRSCRKRYVPRGRTVAQICPHCGATTAKRRAKDSEIRKLADGLFSLFIRLRDFNARGGSCITCNKKCKWENFEAGHFVKRGCDQTRYDEINVNGQCHDCNTKNRPDPGRPWEYGRNIDLLHGEGTAADLKASEKSTFKYNRDGLLTIARHYYVKLQTSGEDPQYILDRYKAAAVEMLGDGMDSPSGD